jgi:hypothetical protein
MEVALYVPFRSDGLDPGLRAVSRVIHGRALVYNAHSLGFDFQHHKQISNILGLILNPSP